MKDVMTWIAAVPTLAGLGLALGMSPILYGAVADTLARGRNVAARITWLLVGLMAGATLLVVVLHGLNPANLVSRVQGEADAVVKDWVVDLSVGVALLVVAAAMALWVRRVPVRQGRADKAPAPASATAPDAKPTAMFVLGATASVVGFTTLPIAYLAGRAIDGVGPELPLRLLGLVVYLAALIAPFVLLAWVWTRFPAATKKVTAAYDKALAWDSRVVAVWVMAAIGVLLVGFSLFSRL